jgi:hypothetical protein
MSTATSDQLRRARKKFALRMTITTDAVPERGRPKIPQKWKRPQTAGQVGPAGRAGVAFLLTIPGEDYGLNLCVTATRQFSVPWQLR